jgi:hypothetical protein
LAQTLAHELGHLPLALEQAATAYIVAKQSRFAAYRTRRLKLLIHGASADIRLRV